MCLLWQKELPMPRSKRLDLRGIPQHIVQQGNNRHDDFFAPDHRRAHLKWLEEGAERSGLKVHSSFQKRGLSPITRDKGLLMSMATAT